MTYTASDGTLFTDRGEYRKYEMEKRFTFRQIVNGKRIKSIGEVEGQPFEIIDCNDSELLVLDYSDQVQIDECVNCKIFIGASSESVFVRNCCDCTITVACKQLRTRDCKRCTFYLFAKTAPVIETSSQIRQVTVLKHEKGLMTIAVLLTQNVRRIYLILEGSLPLTAHMKATRMLWKKLI